MSYGEIYKQSNFGTAVNNDIGYGDTYLAPSLLNQLFIRVTNFENFGGSLDLLNEIQDVL